MRRLSVREPNPAESGADSRSMPAQQESPDRVTAGATISEAFTAEGGFPEEEVTDASTHKQMVIGIGPLNREGVHPYVLESEPTEDRPDQTRLWGHQPGAPGEARVVGDYNTCEVQSLVKNVSYDIQTDDALHQSGPSPQEDVQQQINDMQQSMGVPGGPGMS